MDTPSRPGLRERKKQALRQHILDVSVDRFRSHGYEHTTVEEICELAEIGKATFFRYFPTKQAVLGGFSLATYDLLATQLEVIGVSALDRMREFYRSVEEFARQDRELTRAIVDSGLLDVFVTPTINEVNQRTIARLAEVVARGQTDGEFNPAFEANDLAKSLFVLTYACVADWVAGRRAGPDLVHCVELWAHGASAR